MIVYFLLIVGLCFVRIKVACKEAFIGDFLGRVQVDSENYVKNNLIACVLLSLVVSCFIAFFYKYLQISFRT